MGAEIEPETGARAARLAPALAHLGAITVEVGFELGNLPERPSASRRRTVRKSPSQRRLWKMLSSRCCFSANSTSAFASARSRANGLSITTCLPASRASRAMGAWVSLGVAITTRSTVIGQHLLQGADPVPGAACTLAASRLTTQRRVRPGVVARRGRERSVLRSRIPPGRR
jgi:hypothetical protein